MQQQLLDPNPRLDVRVYAVWFAMYGTDKRADWSPPLLSDRRVIHRWDETKSVGRWYGERLDQFRGRIAPQAVGLKEPIPILWDAYLVYAPDAKWSQFPSGLVRWGRTIIATRATLSDEVTRLARR